MVFRIGPCLTQPLKNAFTNAMHPIDGEELVEVEFLEHTETSKRWKKPDTPEILQVNKKYVICVLQDIVPVNHRGAFQVLNDAIVEVEYRKYKKL